MKGKVIIKQDQNRKQKSEVSALMKEFCNRYGVLSVQTCRCKCGWGTPQNVALG